MLFIDWMSRGLILLILLGPMFAFYYSEYRLRKKLVRVMEKCRLLFHGSLPFDFTKGTDKRNFTLETQVLPIAEYIGGAYLSWALLIKTGFSNWLLDISSSYVFCLVSFTTLLWIFVLSIPFFLHAYIPLRLVHEPLVKLRISQATRRARVLYMFPAMSRAVARASISIVTGEWNKAETTLERFLVPPIVKKSYSPSSSDDSYLTSSSLYYSRLLAGVNSLSPTILYLYVMAITRQDKTGKASKICEEVIKAFPAYWPMYAALAELYAVNNEEPARIIQLADLALRGTNCSTYLIENCFHTKATILGIKAHGYALAGEREKAEQTLLVARSALRNTQLYERAYLHYIAGRIADCLNNTTERDLQFGRAIELAPKGEIKRLIESCT